MSLAACAFGVLGLLAFVLWRLNPVIDPHFQHLMTPLWRYWQSKGPTSVIGGTLWGMVLIVSVALYVAYKETNAFDTPRRSRFYWLYVTLAVLVAFQLFSLGMFFVVTTPVAYYRYPAPPYQTHAVLRENIVLTLLTIGIALYLFKQKAKLAYGISEIIIAIMSNAALMTRIDVTDFPKIGVAWQDWLNVAAFTYLLSRGISNTADAIRERQEKREAARLGIPDTDAPDDETQL